MAGTRISSLGEPAALAAGDLIPGVDISDLTQSAQGTTVAYTADKVRAFIAVRDEKYSVVRSGVTPAASAATNTAGILAADVIVAAAGGGAITFPAGDYDVDAELLFSSNVRWFSPGRSGQVGGAVKLNFTGASGTDRLVGPRNRAVDTINFGIDGVELDGNGLVDVVLDLYRTSYSTFNDFAVYGGIAATGIGVLLDANVSNQCYFNQFDGVKVDGLPVGVRFQSGANANIWRGGRVANGGTGIEFLSLSSGNLVEGTDLEGNSVRCFHCDATGNVIFGVHLESCPIGFNLTTLGAKTHIISPTIAGSITTWLVDASTVGMQFMERAADTFRIRLGTTTIDTPVLAGSTALNVDPQPLAGTGDVFVRLYRFLTTSGTRTFTIHKGDGSATAVLTVDCATARTTVGGPLQVDGQFDHNGTTVGFYGIAPVLRPAAYTQTFATATRTHAARTATTLTDNSGGTANTTVQALADGTVYANDVAAIRNNFADLAAAVNALIADLANTAQVVNSSIDDDQIQGLKQ